MAKIRICKEDKLAHLEGSTICGFETACGYVDSGNTYIDSEGAPTCRGCIDVAQMILFCASAKEIPNWD